MLTNHEHRISYDSTGRLISKKVLDLSVTGNADKWLHSLEYNFLTATLSAHNDKNLFAYCDNYPVSRADDGEFWHIVAGAVIGATVGVVVSVVARKAEYGEVDFLTCVVSSLAGAA